MPPYTYKINSSHTMHCKVATLMHPFALPHVVPLYPTNMVLLLCTPSHTHATPVWQPTTSLCFLLHWHNIRFDSGEQSYQMTMALCPCQGESLQHEACVHILAVFPPNSHLHQRLNHAKTLLSARVRFGL